MIPFWRLYDLESGRIIAEANDVDKFLETAVFCKDVSLTAIRTDVEGLILHSPNKTHKENISDETV